MDHIHHPHHHRRPPPGLFSRSRRLLALTRTMVKRENLILLLSLAACQKAVGFSLGTSFPPFVRTVQTHCSATRQSKTTLFTSRPDAPEPDKDVDWIQSTSRALTTVALGVTLASSSFFGGTLALADTPTKQYDGFAEYAKENQMEKSDVGCFINKCGAETKALFANPRGIKGLVCLGRCKGEQSLATRCFAEYNSPDLSNWLSCAIEENECVKAPRNVDNSAENTGYGYSVKQFDPTSLLGKWYKTDGLNPNYDLFDCQFNTFETLEKDASELDMGIFFRVSRPDSAGGGFWENTLTEHMVVDASRPEIPNPSKRTLHTEGKMNGLQFNENWYIIGQSDGSGDIPEFKLVAYKGHTLQGNYEGSFVYAKEPRLPAAAVPAVREAAARAGLNFDDFSRIDNTCPTGEPLNDALAGTGTSTTDWVELLVGEGGVVDWVFPGWRGEYKP